MIFDVNFWPVWASAFAFGLSMVVVSGIVLVVIAGSCWHHWWWLLAVAGIGGAGGVRKLSFIWVVFGGNNERAGVKFKLAMEVGKSHAVM